MRFQVPKTPWAGYRPFTGRVQSGLGLLLTLTAAAVHAQSPLPVSYYRAATVTQSFERGAVLFDEGRDYMVHTSRRTEPGKVEVHEKDTDIIYVLEGEATFVTGGDVVGGLATGDGEIRGDDVHGGETRRLTPGDVIIVPAGTAHWFKEVQGPVLYYTIKVR